MARRWVYAVRGDCEWMRDWPGQFRGLPVTALPAHATVSAGPVAITGLTVSECLRPVTMPQTPACHIVLGHRPDMALHTRGGDLLLAGHTHGGQVRLPFRGPLITLSAVPRPWAAGVTRLPDGRTLVVSRGLGVEHGGSPPRIRFLCRAEIVVIDLVPAGP